MIILFDVGGVMGSWVIGHMTDLTYARRTPILVLSLILGTGMQSMLILVDGEQVYLFGLIIFLIGFLVIGATNIISGTACADIVINKVIISVYRGNYQRSIAMRRYWPQLQESLWGLEALEKLLDN
jgi:sugar phosphate permease